MPNNVFHQAKYDEPIIFELGCRGRRGCTIQEFDLEEDLVPENLKRKELNLPELSEVEVMRHFFRLSQMNYCIENGIYPLGSCTMKYNPKINEEIANLEKATNVHPLQDESTVQGSLQIMYELQEMLCEIGGVDAVTLQPAAGAQGEFTGILITKAYHELKGEERTEVVLPDTAHGTNPASAMMGGYKVVEIKSDDRGEVDLNELEAAISDKTACFMLTNPNTLGIFEENVLEIAKLVHKAGALLYYDGANLNAIMGIARPGDMGFDIVHYNLHKTFSTPHGGGGPGSGPIGVKENLKNFLPVPIVDYDGKNYYFDYELPHTIGKVKSFYGNFGILIRAYTYIKIMGSNGLREAAEISVLNSNYMKEKLKKHFPLKFKDLRKHEFVLSGEELKEKGIHTKDVGKRLLDYGFHAPTVYFPLIVEEALMIEPTETEPKEELDRFIDALIKIKEEDPEIIKNSPHNLSVGRVDEVSAAKNMFLSWKMVDDNTKNHYQNL